MLSFVTAAEKTKLIFLIHLDFRNAFSIKELILPLGPLVIRFTGSEENTFPSKELPAKHWMELGQRAGQSDPQF